MFAVCSIAIAVLLLLDAAPAAAWGPISHLGHGYEVLQSLTIVGATLQRLLSRHPLEYLYGCVGADITFAKKYTWAQQAHCHSWAVGWQVLGEARTPAERAFAWGYLTHLAADVFSHNHFVPTQLIVTYRTRTLRHIYWEACFDSLQDTRYRVLIGKVRRQSFPECDALIERVVRRTIFSFRTNKRIFNSLLAFHDWRNWPAAMRAVRERTGHSLPPEIVDAYNRACQAAILDLLQRGRRSACQRADPTGFETLAAAQQIRRALRRLDRRDAVPAEVRRRLEQIEARPALLTAAATCAGRAVAARESG